MIDRLDATPYLAATFRHDGRDKARLNRLAELESAPRPRQMLATNDVHFHHPARQAPGRRDGLHPRRRDHHGEAGYLLAPHAEASPERPRQKWHGCFAITRKR
jgi:hypothetical protein